MIIKLLLTGFEAFGGFKINPSEKIVQILDNKEIFGLKILGRTIPLRYSKICPTIDHHIEEINPAFVINMGQAPRPSIAFERVGINIADCKTSAYNCGSKPVEATIIEGGPTGYFSTLPIQELTKYLQDRNIPCYISNTAGTFGCNQIMYCTLHIINTTPRYNSIKAGFVHLPLLPEQAINSPQSSSMSLDIMTKGIELVIEYLGKTLDENI
jgi:pyroglutamyl-peptidase